MTGLSLGAFQFFKLLGDVGGLAAVTVGGSRRVRELPSCINRGRNRCPHEKRVRLASLFARCPAGQDARTR